MTDRDWISWETTLQSETNGLVDLKQIPLVAQNKFGTSYLVAHLERKADGPAVMRFGLEWRGIVWVNGEEVLRTYDGKNKPDSHVVPIRLRKGDNTISFKLGNGSKGNYVWCNVSDEKKAIGPELEASARLAAKGSLYRSENPAFDPFQFIYW